MTESSLISWPANLIEPEVTAYREALAQAGIPLEVLVGGEVRIDYRYPVALDSGKLYVTGLESTSGAVGAEGPIYQVDLTSVLR